MLSIKVCFFIYSFHFDAWSVTFSETRINGLDILKIRDDIVHLRAIIVIDSLSSD